MQSKLISHKNKKRKILTLFFDQNHGLTLRKHPIWQLGKTDIDIKAFFLSRASPNIFHELFFHEKKKIKKIKNFDQNPGPAPHETSNLVAR